MTRMLPEVWQASLVAALAFLDDDAARYSVAIVALRGLDRRRADELQGALLRYRQLDLGRRALWVEQSALLLSAAGLTRSAQLLAQRCPVANRRAELLERLGDLDGAAVAWRAAEEIARAAHERRVIMDAPQKAPRATRTAIEAPGARREPNAGDEQARLDWAA